MWTVDAVWVDCMWEGWFRLGGLRVNGHFICVGLRGKILRSVVGAVPVCPPVSPHKGASIVKIPAHNACVLGMETPLCGRSGGHVGTVPTVSFGWIAHGRLVSLRVDCVCGFVCWENGAHEPTPSVLYF